jgi:hypothetical protein
LHDAAQRTPALGPTHLDTTGTPGLRAIGLAAAIAKPSIAARAALSSL